MSIYTIETIDEFMAVARAFARTLTGAEVVCLSGALGAGKTEFAKTVARVLGVRDHVSSPTFVVYKTYPILSHARLKQFIHADYYRIAHPDERIGFEDDAGEDDTVTFVEWGERATRLKKRFTHRIAISVTDNRRTITVAPIKNNRR